MKLVNQQYITNIRGDREYGFISREITRFLEDNNTKSYLTSCPLTRHNRIVDGIIKTIKDMFG